MWRFHRAGERNKSAGEALLNESEHPTAEDSPPDRQNLDPSATKDDADDSGPEPKSGRTFPVAALVTGLALVAAIAAIPSLGALIAYPLGAAAVLVGLVGWQRSGRGRRLWFAPAAVLLVAFFAVLATSAAGGGGTPGASGGLSSPSISPPEVPRSKAAQSIASPSPTMAKPPPAPSSSITARAQEPDAKPVTAIMAQGSSRYFASGYVLVGIDTIYDNFASLNISTHSDSCNINPSVGDFKIIGISSDGYYRITLLSIDQGKSVTIQVQQVHVTDDTTGNSYACPL